MKSDFVVLEHLIRTQIKKLSTVEMLQDNYALLLGTVLWYVRPALKSVMQADNMQGT